MITYLGPRVMFYCKLSDSCSFRGKTVVKKNSGYWEVVSCQLHSTNSMRLALDLQYKPASKNLYFAK